MLSKFVGETEKNVRDLFADAEQDQRTQGKRATLAKVTYGRSLLCLMLSFLLFRGSK